jgi:hypothetical protein
LTWVNNIRAIKEHDTDDRIAASFSSFSCLRGKAQPHPICCGLMDPLIPR